MAVERIVELVTHKTIYHEISLQLYFIKENCQRLIAVLTSLEAKEAKSSFDTETDRLLAKYSAEQKRKQIKSFQNAIKLSLRKLEVHLDAHPAYMYYKAVRVFDPRQLPTLAKDIGDYCALKALQDPSAELLEEWLIYTQYRDHLPDPLSISDFWEGMKTRFSDPVSHSCECHLDAGGIS